MSKVIHFCCISSSFWVVYIQGLAIKKTPASTASQLSCMFQYVPYECSRACPRNARFSKTLCTFREAGAAKTDHSGIAPSPEIIIVKDSVLTMKAMPMKTMTCQEMLSKLDYVIRVQQLLSFVDDSFRTKTFQNSIVSVQHKASKILSWQFLAISCNTINLRDPSQGFTIFTLVISGVSLRNTLLCVHSSCSSLQLCEWFSRSAGLGSSCNLVKIC